MTPRLEILIASVYARHPLLVELLDTLAPQLAAHHGAARVLVYRDDRDAPVGTKRGRLLEHATGDYVCFVDDDDAIADDYLTRIMLALEHGPDAVGFELAYSRDGIMQKPAIHSSRFDRWGEDEHGYYRTINHLNPVRRELAVACLPFEPGFGEDCAYAEKLAPLVRSEVFLAAPAVYFYRWSAAGSLFGGAAPARVGFAPELGARSYVRLLGEDRDVA